MSAFAERRAAACDQTPFHNSSQTPFTGALCEQVDGYRSAAVAWARDAPPEDAGEGSEAAVVAAVHARILATELRGLLVEWMAEVRIGGWERFDGQLNRIFDDIGPMPSRIIMSGGVACEVTGLPLDRLRQLCESAGVALPRNFDGSVETLAAALREVAEALQCPGRVVASAVGVTVDDVTAEPDRKVRNTFQRFSGSLEQLEQHLQPGSLRPYDFEALGLWAAALINPLPALGVATEIRQAALDLTEPTARLGLVLLAAERSLDGLRYRHHLPPLLSDALRGLEGVLALRPIAALVRGVRKVYARHGIRPFLEPVAVGMVAYVLFAYPPGANSGLFFSRLLGLDCISAWLEAARDMLLRPFASATS